MRKSISHGYRFDGRRFLAAQVIKVKQELAGGCGRVSVGAK
jgi:hypothetical protein